MVERRYLSDADSDTVVVSENDKWHRNYQRQLPKLPEFLAYTDVYFFPLPPLLKRFANQVPRAATPIIPPTIASPWSR